MSARPPCRLFVIAAAEAPRAVVLRRGPSGWYHVLLWHTDTNEIEPGAWFRGRIYEERCDLSPDGRLLLYFALQGRRFTTSYRGSWTAVSRAPWLEALALWPQGDTWGGGGRFTGPRRVVLRNGGPAHPDHPADGLQVSVGRAPGRTSSERDFAGRRLAASDGCLFSDDRLVADLNGLTPDPQPAPESARRPLRRS